MNLGRRLQGAARRHRLDRRAADHRRPLPRQARAVPEHLRRHRPLLLRRPGVHRRERAQGLRPDSHVHRPKSFEKAQARGDRADLRPRVLVLRQQVERHRLRVARPALCLEHRRLRHRGRRQGRRVPGQQDQQRRPRLQVQPAAHASATTSTSRKTTGSASSAEALGSSAKADDGRRG